MRKPFLEAGKIVNTHGLRGEVKIQPWCDSPAFLCSFSTLYIDGAAVKVLRARPQKDCVIAALEGFESVDDAVLLKNKVVFIARSDANLEPGASFVQDIIGLTALDADTGAELGKVTDVIPMSSADVYEIRGEREILVPAVPEFVVETDIESGFIRVRLIEGM